MNSQEYLERVSKKGWRYHLLVEEPKAINLEYIHPLKQKLVDDVAREAQNDPHVKRLIIFGSAITGRCNPFSDLDICVDWIMPSHDDDGVYVPETVSFMKFISVAAKGNVDILSYDDIGNADLIRNIDDGVVVFER